jgi:N-acyl-D-aspartate/D-glutamate deacylase
MSSRFIARALAVAALVLSSAASLPAQAPRTFDVLIRNGRVLDGSGNPWVRTDIGIRGDRIVAMGDLGDATATTVIAADSFYVAPGFIDSHSHAGEGLARPTLSAAQQLLAQGLTTILANPDGGGPVDLAAQRAAFEKNGVGVNVFQMIGHGAVRGAVLGMADRAPTADELTKMEALVEKGFEDGAVGFSS